MTRDIRLYIEDILDSIEKIESYIKDVDEKEFLKNTQVQDSILRRLEVIGEAVKKIPSNIRSSYTEIPWKNIAGLRDVLIHEYFGVNINRVWKLAKYDLYSLKQQILKVKKDISDSNFLFEG